MTAQATTERFIDPVCHMKVTKDGKVAPVTLRSHTYYFCAEACRKAFVDDPDKYLSAKGAKRKGFWSKYLNRLNKATGGKPPSCCQ